MLTRTQLKKALVRESADHSLTFVPRMHILTPMQVQDGTADAFLASQVTWSFQYMIGEDELEHVIPCPVRHCVVGPNWMQSSEGKPR